LNTPIRTPDSGNGCEPHPACSGSIPVGPDLFLKAPCRCRRHTAANRNQRADQRLTLGRLVRGLLIFIIFAAIASRSQVVAADFPESTHSPGVAIFVSKNIRPYVEAADGMHEVFSGLPEANVRKFFLDRLTGKAAADQAARISDDQSVNLVVAIGPEAAAFVWQSFPDPFPARIYSIILNPEKIVGSHSLANGISLNIPPAVQLGMIKKGLPSLQQIGIIYDPDINRDFYDAAADAARHAGIQLVPVTVSSSKEIPDILNRAFEKIDGIWLIPDRTVISESIAQYIIKQAVLQKIPVIGYNQFFYDSGAALAFVFDYRELGRQAADLAAGLASGETSAEDRVPEFQVWLNAGVIQKLGIGIPDALEPPVRIGP
jgi:putative tryptophan/tyrosine transport system substrate-binding protein